MAVANVNATAVADSHKVDPEEGWTSQVRATRSYNRRLLFSTLDAIEGDKTIIWSESLMKRVSVFATDLKEHGVVANSVLDKKYAAPTTNVLFFVEKSLAETNKLVDYLKTVKHENALNHVFFIPEEWYVARQKLKDDKAVWEKLESVKALPLWWLPYEGDCISLDEPTLPSRVLLNGDWTVLHRCAAALFELERMSGRQFVIYTKGKWSQDVSNMLVKMRQADSTSSSFDSTTEVPVAALKLTRLVLVDRWLDPLSPLITPMTYAAMLDDLYGIRMRDLVKVPEAAFEKKEGEEAEHHRNSLKDIHLNDEIFHRLKHVHFRNLSNVLSLILSDLRREEEYGRGRMSVAEMLLFVKKLPAIEHKKNRTSQHVRLFEMIMDEKRRRLSVVDDARIELDLLSSPDGDRILPAVEDTLITAQSAHTSLRLIAIQSLTGGGLKSSVLQQYRRMVYQAFGMDALNRFVKMQKIGLIREKGGQRFVPTYSPLFLFSQMAKAYNLLPVGMDPKDSSDASYAFEFYAPLLVRIVEEGVKLKFTGWQTPKGNSTASTTPGGATEWGQGGTALFVVGGLTRAEIAGLRRIPEIGLISTSAILTRNKVIDSLTNIL